MNSTELKDFFREQLRDDVAPYLWSDEEVFLYMNEAQRMFVRSTSGIFDVSSEATEVSITEGEKYSELHPSITHIRQAVYDDKYELKIVNLSDMATLGSGNDYRVAMNKALSMTPGTVVYMIIGEERNKCRWVSLPDTSATVKLSVTRMPLTNITADGQTLEVAEEHHTHLLEWMKSMAYRKQDADAFNPKAAEEGEVRFNAYCAKVWKEWERYRHKPRTVAYGGL